MHVMEWNCVNCHLLCLSRLNFEYLVNSNWMQGLDFEEILRISED